MRRRGDIWTANLNSGKGTEPGKTCPVVIFQSQTLLDVDHPSTIVMPLTTNLISGAAPLRLRVRARDRLQKDSDVLVDQLRAIDNVRLVDGPLATLSTEELTCLQDYVLEVQGVSGSH
jgi:mRNA interferase MazF